VAGEPDVAAGLADHEVLEELRRHIVRTEGVDAVKRYFHFKPLWQRAAVVVAGPLANFILAIAIFAALLLAAGEDVLPARVGEVDAGSPAAVAGFRPGDLIVEANGRRVDSFQDVAEAAVLRVGLPTEYAVERAGARVELTAVSALRVRPDPLGMMRKQGTLGIHPVQGPDAWVHMTYNPLQAVEAGVHRTGRIISTTVYYLGRMVRGQVSADQLNGPLGIANTTRAVTAQAAHAPTFGGMVIMAVGGLVSLAGFISVGVGFMNLLPVPVLDGGHLLFYAYEAVARRPLAAQVQAAGYRVGLALVLGLMLFATWNDLQQLSVFKNLGRLFL